jgi:hypothetical protein
MTTSNSTKVKPHRRPAAAGLRELLVQRCILSGCDSYSFGPDREVFNPFDAGNHAFVLIKVDLGVLAAAQRPSASPTDGLHTRYRQYTAGNVLLQTPYPNQAASPTHPSSHRFYVPEFQSGRT